VRGGLPSFVAVACLVLLLVANPADAAVPSPAGAVVEHLRLKVPAATRDAWLEAERLSWEPWLRGRPGFMGRELLWDPEREEGVLLIRWRTRQAWKTIPPAEIDAVQERFERIARDLLHSDATAPFPLLHSGELLPLARSEDPGTA
jgi:uncharacterized protein (TIGR03792 family)